MPLGGRLEGKSDSTRNGEVEDHEPDQPVRAPTPGWDQGLMYRAALGGARACGMGSSRDGGHKRRGGEPETDPEQLRPRSVAAEMVAPCESKAESNKDSDGKAPDPASKNVGHAVKRSLEKEVADDLHDKLHQQLYEELEQDVHKGIMPLSLMRAGNDQLSRYEMGSTLMNEPAFLAVDGARVAVVTSCAGRMPEHGASQR